MLEVLSPAGSSDALVAAVQNGADAVYLGFGGFNARMNARNFTEEQLRQSVVYCHVRGVKVYLTLNTLVLDREMKAAAEVVKKASDAGVDAILVQDFGVCAMVHEVAPDMPIHASTQMAVHNLTGVLKAAEMGISRVVLARELSGAQIAEICRQSPVEIEVFVHGALCMCYSGQCYLSAMIGRRSGNRGQCAQPCRMSYGYDRGENRYPLSLKDNCLVSYVRELEKMGVSCIKIEGRMKRPEYVAIATRIYKEAAMGRRVTPGALEELRKAFSRQGFTDGYYRGKKGKNMFGVHMEEEGEREVLARARTSYVDTEIKRVAIGGRLTVLMGRRSMLQLWDEEGRIVAVQGDMPELARRQALTAESASARLQKTGGTPYYFKELQTEIMPGLTLSAAALNSLRRSALSLMTAERGKVPSRTHGRYTPPQHYRGNRGKPVFTVEITALSQITSDLVAMKPEILYVPLHLLDTDSEMAIMMCRAMHVCAVLPRVIKDDEWELVYRMLGKAELMGVHEALIGNIGMIDMVRRAGMTPRGDFGLNLFNSGDAAYLASQGLASGTASFELTLPQIRDLSKPLPIEMIAYGRLPLMITENCILHNRADRCICESGSTALVDRTGSRFPIIRDGATCRSQLLNSKKLYLGDKQETLSGLGLWALRIKFTVEDSHQVDAVLKDFREGGAFDPGSGTRGLYSRGVE